MNLNNICLEYNKRQQALTSLGEDIDTYGRVLTSEILCAFPDDVCERWTIHAKRGEIPEGDIMKQQQVLFEKIEGALTTLKIQGEPIEEFRALPSTVAFNANLKTENKQTKKNPIAILLFT
ncbi:uncharacterized protein NPIL_61771 [Nephila pilipes]|uniref:Uncharacterized protein n=1 Tax=Nephila pilipes TaxID=299642 RepID=A0A8X6QPY5_NEPPI|nr:uncharacterized protein NPIL_61771 [Nephila pilipes]